MADLAGLLGAYGGSEDEDEHMEPSAKEQGGGLVTMLGHSDEEENGDDLAHLTVPAPPTVEGPRPPTPAEQQAAAEQAVAATAPSEPAELDGVNGAHPGTRPGYGVLPVELADEPPGEPDAQMAEKVRRFLGAHARGADLKRSLRSSRDYRNPEFFLHMVRHLGIEQYSTCFDPEVYDPKALPPEDHLAAMRKAWAAEEERRRAARAASQRVEFARPASQTQLGGASSGAPPRPPPPTALNAAAALAAAQAKAAQLAASFRQ